MKNKLTDLNNYLFEQIERLNDDELSDEQIDQAIKKAEAITEISKTIIQNSALQLKAVQVAAEYGVIKSDDVRPLLTGGKSEPQV